MLSNKLIRQAKLVIEHEDGYTTTMITWLDDHPKLAVGRYVTLKGETRRWKVLHLSDPKISSEIKRTFDNNNYDKHTGLKYAK